MHLTLKHPFSMLICGPSGSGKTVFTVNLLKHARAMIDPPPEELVWCYGVHQQKVVDDISKIVGSTRVRFNEGVPDAKEFDGSRRVLLVLDDLMHEAGKSVAELFTRDSHHRNVSVVFLTQNIFAKSAYSRTINLNAHYLVVFKNPRDRAQIAHLSRQMFPNNVNFLVDAFHMATDKQPYAYLVVDLKADTEDELRVRTRVFPDDEMNFVFVPKRAARI